MSTTETFYATILDSEVTGFGNIGASINAWTNPSDAPYPDGSAATVTIDSTSASKILIVNGFVWEGDELQTVATRMGAGATLEALSFEVNIGATGGPIPNISFKSQCRGASNSALGTSQVGTMTSVSTAGWRNVPQTGAIHSSATGDDVVSASFGFAFRGICTNVTTAVMSVDGIRMTATWTPAPAASATPRRQNFKLRDGRIAAVRIR